MLPERAQDQPAAPMLDLVPVLDLMGGVVVRARAGQRDAYPPLSGSKIVASAEPLAVAEAMLALHPFARLYIADLDAIQGRGTQTNAILELERALPAVELWVDAGLNDPDECAAFLGATAAQLVLGSESQRDPALLEALADEPRLILSLDSTAAGRLDPAGLQLRPDLWPMRVIAMTLAAVGGGAGPDLATLRRLLDVAGPRRLYAAGGVRDASDLRALETAGLAGVLVASALHDGRLDAAALAPWRRPVTPPTAAAPELVITRTLTVELDAASRRALGELARARDETPEQTAATLLAERLATSSTG